MTREEFERLIEEEFENAIPEKFRPHIKNVAFLVEDEPSAQVRKLEGLHEGETLLGYYHGVPYPERGDFYGMGTTMPDTITLYQKPIEDEAEELLRRQAGERGRSRPLGQALPSFPQPDGSEVLRKVIRETIWHEVAHLFGMGEHEVRQREEGRDSM